MDFKKKKKRNNETISTKKAFKFLLSYVKRHYIYYILGIIVLVFVDLAQLVIPRVIQKVIDLLSLQNFDQNLILKNSLFILLLALGMAFLRFFWRLFIIGSARKIEMEVRDDMFVHLQKLSFSFFNRTKTGDLMALMINDLKAVRRATGPSFIMLTDALFMGTMALIFMLSINVKLTLYVILPLPLIIIIMLKFGTLLQSRFKKVQESFASISSHAQETFSGIRVVKGFNQEKSESKNFYNKCNEYVYKNIDLIKVWGLLFPLINFLASISISLLYLIGGKFVILKTISLGEFISFSFYIGLIIWPMMAIGWVFNIFQRGLASTKRIMHVMEEKPEIFDRKYVDRSIKKIEGEIYFSNLSFSYGKDQREVLKNIDLKIHKGMKLGVMGRPGSGKSTLVSLIFHLFNIEENKLFIDGVDINKIPLNILRKSIGYVPQDSFLFSDTILNNIAFGIDDDSIDFEKVKHYAKIADIYDDILNFPDGFNTLLGERGVTLSGGQKQRIAIARALIINPDILILDDALSSVDASTEKVILNNIKSELEKRTSIIIAHRVSTVKDCDHIIILDDGKIIEQGTHEQLLKIDGFYAKLFNLQKLEENLIVD